MSTDSRDLWSAAGGEFSQPAAQLDHVDTGIDNRLANFGAELDHRLVHLRLDLLFKDNLPILENLLDVRPQLARLRIDNREFLFDTESKRVVLGAHRGAQISARNNALSSREAPATSDLTKSRYDSTLL